MNKENENKVFFSWELAIKLVKPLFFVIGISIIVVMIKKIGVGELVSLIKRVSPFYLCLALVVWLSHLAVATLRFRSLSAPQIAYRKAFEVLLMGYLLNYASAIQGAGVGARVGLLKGEKVEVAQSLAGSGAEVFLDLVFTAIIALVFAVYVGVAKSGLGQIHPLPFLIGGGVGVLAICFILFLGKRGGFWGSFVSHLKDALSLWQLPKNILWTMLIWVFSGLGFYFILLAMGEEITPFLTISAMAVGFVIGFVSLVPGGLGVRDFSWAYVVSLGGVPLRTSAGAALFLRLIYIMAVAVLVALLMLWRKKG